MCQTYHDYCFGIHSRPCRKHQMLIDHALHVHRNRKEPDPSCLASREVFMVDTFHGAIKMISVDAHERQISQVLIRRRSLRAKHEEWQPVLDVSNIEKYVKTVLDRMQGKLYDKENHLYNMYQNQEQKIPNSLTKCLLSKHGHEQTDTWLHVHCKSCYQKSEMRVRHLVQYWSLLN